MYIRNNISNNNWYLLVQVLDLGPRYEAWIINNWCLWWPILINGHELNIKLFLMVGIARKYQHNQCEVPEENHDTIIITLYLTECLHKRDMLMVLKCSNIYHIPSSRVNTIVILVPRLPPHNNPHLNLANWRPKKMIRSISNYFCLFNVIDVQLTRSTLLQSTFSKV